MSSTIENTKECYEEERNKERNNSWFDKLKNEGGMPLGEIFVLYATSDVGKSCFHSNTKNTE